MTSFGAIWRVIGACDDVILLGLDVVFVDCVDDVRRLRG